MNAHWPASYRHPAHRDAGSLEQAVLEAFDALRPLMAGATAAGGFAASSAPSPRAADTDLCGPGQHLPGVIRALVPLGIPHKVGRS